MLFDEKDFRAFDNADSRNYFKEILQSYYSQNYRATIVLLYAFVIYDLFIKLQTMANEGDKKADKKLKEINTMIADDEKYSKVENEVVQFFKDNCPLYFDKFIEDIEYLKNCRNKCAHLKVNDNTLYVPSDYHARMLICSMYDHILSVKAPFIMDLFSIAQVDVEGYSNSISSIPSNGLDESIKKSIIDKYLKRMTYDSIKKSYKTFIRLLFVSDSEECIKNVYGLYAFAFSMTDYSIKKGYTSLFKEESILDVFSKINAETLKDSTSRVNTLIAIITTYPVIMDILRDNEDVFEYISRRVLNKPYGLEYYRGFYPREKKSVYAYFKEQPIIHAPSYSETIYESVKECDDFNLAEYMQIMVESIPPFNGFYDADCFMNFFKGKMKELTEDEINEVLKVYQKNSQCTNRARNTADMKEIEKYIQERKKDESGSDVE
jgi:hypothetical protein